ncbi:erythromycin esterase family protein [Rhizophagus irregularis DAOM 181602=DAOM 197198]|nr:erythromycin esterase family protein [Rhizophagus irregularis DAOM 181602=DAOM 197198]
MVVKDSEEYYRTMIDAGTKSWNLRDSHMLRMLEALIKYLEPQRPTIVTSETHKGKLRKEWNIGQLARKQFGMDKGYNIGFTTYNGSDYHSADQRSRGIFPEHEKKVEECLFATQGIPYKKNRQMYVFVGCLAFAKIKKNKDNNYVALDGYLEHLDVSQVHPAAILKDNMKFIELNLRGNVLIDNKRFLLTSQDIINFRNSITKNALDIDIRNSVEKNIHQIFEVNDDEVISLL